MGFAVWSDGVIPTCYCLFSPLDGVCWLVRWSDAHMLLPLLTARWGVLVFFWSAGLLMPLITARWGVLVFSWSAGVMYSTLFTMPYLLVAHYHETDTVSTSRGGQVRFFYF